MPIRFPLTRRISSGGRLSMRDHGKTGDGFPGAGFADHAQHLALGDVKGNSVDGAQRAAAGGEFHPEVAHGENGYGHAIRYSRTAALLIVASD